MLTAREGGKLPVAAWHSVLYPCQAPSITTNKWMATTPVNLPKKQRRRRSLEDEDRKGDAIIEVSRVRDHAEDDIKKIL